MKLMTLNTHSLVEQNYPQKLLDFTDAVMRIKPDVIALQEVNQLHGDLDANRTFGYLPCQKKISLKIGNHALNIARMLSVGGIEYSWTWLPMKIGYGIFDEGLAIMSRRPILEMRDFYISKTQDYKNWRTRKILGICNEDGWFYTVHTSWWTDKEESFEVQWEKLCENIGDDENVWLMGDFNNPAEVRNQGYDLIEKNGWYDCFKLAEKRCGKETVIGEIDGWRDKGVKGDRIRIDQIWCRKKQRILTCETVFDGSNEPVVSDHFGVMAETAREE